jgi:hypothetical protein
MTRSRMRFRSRALGSALASPYRRAEAQGAGRSSRRTALTGAALSISVAAAVLSGLSGAAAHAQPDRQAGGDTVRAAASTTKNLCRLAFKQGQRTERLAGQTPTSIFQTWQENGEWFHLAYNGQACLGHFRNNLKKTPKGKEYLRDLQIVDRALQACASEPFKYDHAKGGVNPAYSYHNYFQATVNGAQGGDKWFACLGKDSLPTPKMREAGNYGMNPDSAIANIAICRDNPNTPWPDHKDCTQGGVDKFYHARGQEAASREDAAAWLAAARQSGDVWGLTGQEERPFPLPTITQTLGLELEGSYGDTPVGNINDN